MAGYSMRSVAEKLGLKSGMRIALINAPNGYLELLGKLLPETKRLARPGANMDLIHVFDGS